MILTKDSPVAILEVTLKLYNCYTNPKLAKSLTMWGFKLKEFLLLQAHRFCHDLVLAILMNQRGLSEKEWAIARQEREERVCVFLCVVRESYITQMKNVMSPSSYMPPAQKYQNTLLNPWTRNVRVNRWVTENSFKRDITSGV